ncbi:hypothetical protein [Lentzea guizhouensis]|uniref:hypothetical protein n=1 Tax=Lentzea guizhouensis TaxID=1586287 RepID=UPI0008FF07D8|nr:hypothetical protein [Lentzea guizhouensis]
MSDVLSGRDPRLLVVVGPCSVHDTDAALEYAALLAQEARRLSDDLVLVLRAYLEKPRTVAGWTGFLTDPTLDGKGDIATACAVAASSSWRRRPPACRWPTSSWIRCWPTTWPTRSRGARWRTRSRRVAAASPA